MNDVMERLKEIAEAVTQSAHAGSLEQVLESIARVSQELVNAKFSALGVPDGRGGLRYFKTVGIPADEAKRIGHLPHGEGLLGAIMEERATLRIDRMQDDPRSAGFCENHPSMTTLLGVPIQVGTRLFGTLYLCDRADGQPFDDNDQWLIETMAGYAALAIAGAELGEQQSLVTLLEERERISMELHDGVIQSLYAIGMHLELARTGKTLRSSDLDHPIDELNMVIEDIRRYILNLNSRDQRQKSVYRCFQDVLGRLSIPASLSVSLDAPDTYPPFTPGTFEGICQIVNEVVSNVIRHAGANQLSVVAQERENRFEVVISDNGKGFDTEHALRADGLGLRNIQQRAMIHSGRVAIESEPGKGTRVTITIPT